MVISCSLDSSVKVWQPVDPPTPGAVMDISPLYVHPPEEPGRPVSLQHPAPNPPAHLAAIGPCTFSISLLQTLSFEAVPRKAAHFQFLPTAVPAIGTLGLAMTVILGEEAASANIGRALQV